jgi:hypothetical protein
MPFALRWGGMIWHFRHQTLAGMVQELWTAADAFDFFLSSLLTNLFTMVKSQPES